MPVKSYSSRFDIVRNPTETQMESWAERGSFARSCAGRTRDEMAAGVEIDLPRIVFVW